MVSVLSKKDIIRYHYDPDIMKVDKKCKRCGSKAVIILKAKNYIIYYKCLDCKSEWIE